MCLCKLAACYSRLPCASSLMSLALLLHASMQVDNARWSGVGYLFLGNGPLACRFAAPLWRLHASGGSSFVCFKSSTTYPYALETCQSLRAAVYYMMSGSGTLHDTPGTCMPGVALPRMLVCCSLGTRLVTHSFITRLRAVMTF